jgi:DNA-binding response OmpR family regulator
VALLREGSSRVLLVEDEAELGVSIGQALREAGLVVNQVGREEALSVLEHAHHDLLLLDLAGLAGWEFLEQIHDQPGLPPVLVLSSHGTEARSGPYRQCVAAYLFRPVAEAEVVGTCERILALSRRAEAFTVERRRLRRRRLLARVTLGSCDARVLKGRLLNVSGQGFQVELGLLSDPGKPGDRVSVRVQTAGESPVLTGRIRWWRALPTGCLLGAELDEESEGNADALSQLLPSR